MDKKQDPQKPVVPDLPVKPIQEKSAGDVKGGAMATGPGTQTEDEVYVGLRKR